MSEKEIKKYGVENRAVLLERVARGARTAVDTLITAADNGDVRASEILLKKVLPDLKAVDISQTGEGVKIIINQKIYPGRGKKGEQTVELPTVNINIKEGKAKQHEIIDVTPSVSVSEPPATSGNYRAEREKGKFS